MSLTLGGERQPASDRVDGFSGLERERVQRGGRRRLGLKPVRSTGLLRRMRASGLREGRFAAVTWLGSLFA